MSETMVMEKTPAEMVEEYITLRDGKKVAADKFSEWEDTNFNSRMKDLEIKLLDTLNKLGSDSISSKSGTVYKKVTTSVTVADGREFQKHVIDHAQWELIDWRANKTAVNDLVESGEPLPPGINRSAFVSVGIRRK